MLPTATKELTVLKAQLCKTYRMLLVINSWLYCKTYREKAKFLLKIFYLLYKHTHLLVCRRVPGTSLCATPRATGKDTIGKLSTEWAGKFTLVNRETLEDLVILKKKKKNKQTNKKNMWKFNLTYAISTQNLKEATRMRLLQSKFMYNIQDCTISEILTQNL